MIVLVIVFQNKASECCVPNYKTVLDQAILGNIGPWISALVLYNLGPLFHSAALKCRLSERFRILQIKSIKLLIINLQTINAGPHGNRLHVVKIESNLHWCNHLPPTPDARPIINKWTPIRVEQYIEKYVIHNYPAHSIFQCTELINMY